MLWLNNGDNIMQQPRLLTEQLICGDYLDVAAKMSPDSVDLVFGSPPYEDCRTYGIDFKLKGQDWVDWMVQVVRESARISKGLVAFVVQGRTRKFKWSCTPALLIADLHRVGFNVRNPAIYHRSGIPGSGGPDWLRSDYEWIVCVSKPGRLVWSDNTACGAGPLYRVGGRMSHRHKDGKRANQSSKNRTTHKRYIQEGEEYSGVETIGNKTRLAFQRPKDKSGKSDNFIEHEGGVVEYQNYTPPKISNPGNVIKCKVGGGHLGSKLAHENEAPFPEKLAEFFIKSFCPPGGVVLDPFGGSATTASVAKQNGRGYINIDIRQSQIELAQRRLNE